MPVGSQQKAFRDVGRSARVCLCDIDEADPARDAVRTSTGPLDAPCSSRACPNGAIRPVFDRFLEISPTFLLKSQGNRGIITKPYRAFSYKLIFWRQQHGRNYERHHHW